MVTEVKKEQEVDNENEQERRFSWEPCGLRVKKGDSDGINDFICKGEWATEVDFRVELSRTLTWDVAKKEWRWHKTWRLPDLIVRANAESLGYGVEVRVAIVCAGASGNELTDAGIITTDKKSPDATLQLVDGQCRFTRLRLVGTSSTHGGRRFHILVSLVKDKERKDGPRRAIASLISTAFSVYSRKNADKKRKAESTRNTGRWSEGYDFAPFDPSEFNRVFVKKINDHQGHTTEEPIDNSWQGLLRYFQAPNIRFKCRHPLFLAVRFSNVLVILRDRFRWPDPSSEETLRSFICSCGFPIHCKRDDPVNIGHGEFLPPWLIALRKTSPEECPPAVVKKLRESLSVIKGPALGFVADHTFVPKRYTQTENVAELKALYTRLFELEFAAKRKADAATSPESNKRRRRLEHAMDPSKAGYVGPDDDQDSASEPSSLTNIPTVVDGGAAWEVRQHFHGYFKSLHNELRMLLSKVVECASLIVTDSRPKHIQDLRHAYHDFTEALQVHAYIEENILFPELSKKVPHLTESYHYDHAQEHGRLSEIKSIMCYMRKQQFADLFLKISEFAALHTAHMDKEEKHLLPYFLKKFSDEEIMSLIDTSEEKTIDLTTNVRHTAAINQAIAQAQAFERDYGYPPQSAALTGGQSSEGATSGGTITGGMTSGGMMSSGMTTGGVSSSHMTSGGITSGGVMSGGATSGVMTSGVVTSGAMVSGSNTQWFGDATKAADYATGENISTALPPERSEPANTTIAF